MKNQCTIHILGITKIAGRSIRYNNHTATSSIEMLLIEVPSIVTSTTLSPSIVIGNEDWTPISNVVASG
jgi:hypothetical protein